MVRAPGSNARYLPGLASGAAATLTAPRPGPALGSGRIAPWPRALHGGARKLCSTGSRSSGAAKGAVPERPPGSVQPDAYSDIAFAFDIDGVLYSGRQGIPGAREMLRNIRSRGIRYVFLTNGGGVREDAKAASLVRYLHMSSNEDVIGDRVIVSHSPMRAWRDAVKSQTALITGSRPETSREIVNEYGFSRVVTAADLMHANDSIYPFDQFKDSVHARHRPLPDGKSASRIGDSYSRDIAADALKIDQILVWNDPRDWSLDIQVIYDLLVSHRGYLGTVSDKNGDATLPNNGWQQDGQPPLWVSNLDLFWKTEFPVNRLGTGAFVEALRGVWTAVTGGAALQFRALGKPSAPTYEYAHERLLGAAGAGRRALRRVYMIGDNPESDIRGANEFRPGDGAEWVPVLVRTGVWRPTAAEREPRHLPAAIVDDVVDAVAWALRNEGVDATRDGLVG